MEGDFFNEDIQIPYNLQLEKLVLGSLLNDNNLYEQVLFLKESDFFEQFHQKLLKRITIVVNKGQVADKVTFVEFFQKHEVEISYLEEICSSKFTNIQHYAESLREIAKRRHIFKIGKQLVQSALDDEQITDQVALAEKEIFEIQTESKEYNNKFVSVADGMQEVLDFASNPQKHESKMGIKSGFKDLENLLGGFRKGELFILAGRPATGKTAFALNVALNITQSNKKVLFISLEMSYEQICARALSILSKTPLSYLIHGQLSTDAIDNCKKAVQDFRDMSFFIKDCSFITIPSLKTLIRQVKRNEGVDIVIIDYLQLIESAASKNENRETEISRISRGLKLLAKELEVPVIALSQLSRDIEKRKDTPKLSDLRGSGALEQDADNVAILYMPNEEKPNQIVLYLGKNRNGAVGEVYLTFENQLTKFHSSCKPEIEEKEEK